MARADHGERALGQVEQARAAVDEHRALRDQGEDRTRREPQEAELKKVDHASVSWVSLANGCNGRPS